MNTTPLVVGDNKEQPVTGRVIAPPAQGAFPKPTGLPAKRRYPGGVTTTGYNIINTFTDRIAAAGVLAGFSIAVVALIVAVTGSTPTIVDGLHFKDLSSALVGLAAVLFIASMEFFLNAKENNVWDLPQKYQDAVAAALGDRVPTDKLPDLFNAMNDALVASERYGRYAYNVAIFLLFIGIFFVLYPVSWLAAVIVLVSGLFLELWQAVRWDSFRPR
jgi:hypothetical protein